MRQSYTSRINIPSTADSVAALGYCGQSLISLISPLSTEPTVNSDDARWSNVHLPEVSREKTVNLVDTLQATQHFFASQEFRGKIYEELLCSDDFAKRLDEKIEAAVAAAWKRAKLEVSDLVRRLSVNASWTWR